MKIQANFTEDAVADPQQATNIGSSSIARSPATQRLHVISVFYDYAPNIDSHLQFLERYSTVGPWAQALREMGVQITIASRFLTDLVSHADGIKFHFCSDRYGNRLRRWQIPSQFHSLVGEVASKVALDTGVVVHAHGLFHPLQIKILRRLLPDHVPIIVQHHAEHPWRSLIRPMQRSGLRAADGFFFSATELASSWTQQRLIGMGQKIFPIMEGSSSFRPSDRTAARQRTQLSGDPVVLWVGRLISLKDPLTVLEGFECLLQQLPRARLYMAYTADDLLPAVRARISSRPELSASVTLLGEIPHEQLEDIYNSADYFVLGSHYEGSGFALAEAMACGVVPVVTAIPSFCAMTGYGQVGACWTPGDSSAFVDAFLRAHYVPLRVMSERTASYFDSHLSYRAIARNSIAAYKLVLAARNGMHR